jgi:hypothetical protein
MLTDCEKCWNTPCDCGWEYRNVCYEYRIKLACAILGITPEQLLDIPIPVIHPKHTTEGKNDR